MKRLRLLLLAPLALTVAGAAQAQMQGPAQINPGAIAAAERVGPVRISAWQGFDLSAGAATVARDLVDARSDDAFIIEGPIHMAAEGFSFFYVTCRVYSGSRIIGSFERAGPIADGPFEGTFRFGLRRTGAGEATSFACYANAYGQRNGRDWRAFEEANAGVPGGYVQLVKMTDGSFWDGPAFTQQVVLHISGALAGMTESDGPIRGALRLTQQIPDGSDVQWRPPIIPPGWARFADIPGRMQGDWVSASDYLNTSDRIDSVRRPGGIPQGGPVPDPRPN